MKIFLSGIIIFSVLSFQFSELIIIVSFKINQDYIAKNLCVEKDVAGSTCKGCCQLKKKLNEQQEQKKELPPLPENKQDFNFFSETFICVLYRVKSKKNFHFEYINNYTFSVNHPVFHPPKMNF
jgi:hypothetical protein